MQIICPACNTSYKIPDDKIPKERRAVTTCKKCGGKITIEPSAVKGPDVGPQELKTKHPDPVFDRDKFLLRQKHLAISEKYYVWDEQGESILYIERPRHMFRNLVAILAGIFAGIIFLIIFAVLASIVAFQPLQFLFGAIALIGGIATIFVVAVALSQKRHITFYRDDTKQESLLEVIQDKKFHFLNATYTVIDYKRELLARLRKNYIYSIIRKRWYCYTPDGLMLCIAKEDSIVLSLLRRFLGSFFGLLRRNFVILRGEDVVGQFNRKFAVLDRYVLDMSADQMKSIDRRIALALGVMLDTGERR